MNRQVLAITAFTGLYMIAAIAGAIAAGNSEFIFYITIMLVLIALVIVAHFRIGLTAATLWCLSVWGLLHMAGGLIAVPDSWPINGDIRVLYSWWLIPDLLKYDHVVHAFGFGVTTWVCWQGLRAAVRPHGNPAPTFGILLLCVAAGMGFGALNEIIEFIATLAVPQTNVGGYINTGWDLVSNAIGCLTAAVLIRLTYSKPAQ